MFNCGIISLVFIAMTFAVSQGFFTLANVENSAQASAPANNKTSSSKRQPLLTLFSRFVKPQEQFFHFNPDKHQGAETEANHQFKRR